MTVLASQFTAHGLHNLDRQKPLCRGTNLIYTWAFLLGLAGFCYHASFLISQFMEGRTVTHLAIWNFESGRIEYPSVTLCSLNPFRLSEIHKSKNLNNIQAAYNFGLQTLRAVENSTSNVNATDRKRRETAVEKAVTLTSDTDEILGSSRRVKRYNGERQIWNWGCFNLTEVLSMQPVIQTTNILYADPDHTQVVLPATAPMSNEYCWAYCKTWLIAGVLNGKECLCISWSRFDRKGINVSDSFCNTPCEDGSRTAEDCTAGLVHLTEHECADCGGSQCCGSADYINLYWIRELKGDRGHYVGCYYADEPGTFGRANNDTKNPRRRNFNYAGFPIEEEFPLSLPAENVTVEKCAAFCSGMEFAAITEDRYCECSAFLGEVGQWDLVLDESQCNMACSGGGLKADCTDMDCDTPTSTCDGKQCCGGMNARAIYTTDGCAQIVPNIVAPYGFVFASNTDTISVECKPSFKLAGDELPTCSGTDCVNASKLKCLNPNPVCVPCELPSLVIAGYTLPNGDTLDGYAISDTLLFSAGESVSFACMEPSVSQLEGAQTLNCVGSVDEEWDNPMPRCVPISFNLTSTFPIDFNISQFSQSQIDSFYELLEELEMNGTSHSPDGELRLNARARVAMEKELSVTPPELIDEMTEDVQSVIPFCRFNSRLCDYEASFDKIPHGMYGQCHIFNRNRTQFAHSSGIASGLRTMIHSDHRDHLLTSDTLGGKLLLHEPGSYPFPEVNGVNLAPGFHYTIAFRKVLMSYATACAHQSSADSVFPNDYRFSQESCLRSCTANQVFDLCDCTDGRYPQPSVAGKRGVRPCKDKDSCYVAALKQAFSTCQCEHECRYAQFSVTVAPAVWPLSTRNLKRFRVLPANQQQQLQFQRMLRDRTGREFGYGRYLCCNGGFRASRGGVGHGSVKFVSQTCQFFRDMDGTILDWSNGNNPCRWSQIHKKKL